LNLSEYHFKEKFLNKAGQAQGNIDDEPLSYEEVAKILKVDIMTVRGYVQKGLLESHNMGEPGKRGLKRVMKSDVSKFLHKK
jgi:excisionase family DNA binding protein